MHCVDLCRRLCDFHVRPTLGLVIVQVQQDINTPGSSDEEGRKLRLQCTYGEPCDIEWMSAIETRCWIHISDEKCNRGRNRIIRALNRLFSARLLLLHNIAIGYLILQTALSIKHTQSGFSSTFIFSWYSWVGFILLIERCCFFALFIDAQRKKRNWGSLSEWETYRALQ